MMPSIRELFDRTPPHDLQSEAGLNGAALLMPSEMPAMIESGYYSSIFFDERQRDLCQAIRQTYAEHGTVDKNLVRNWLVRHGNDAVICTMINALDNCPNAVNWPHWLSVVRDCWAKRRTWLTGEQLLRASLNGQSAFDIAGDAIRSLEEIKCGADAGKRFPSYSLADLEAMELETTFLADGALVKGQPALLAGAQKTLKTCIAQDLALSLATGGHALGRFKVTAPMRVCFATGESGLPTVRETFRRQCHKVGRHPADVEGLIVSDKLPWLGGDGNDLPALCRWLNDNGADVLFLDPVYLCLDTDNKESSVFAMGRQLKPLAEACQEIGTTLVLLHHAKRTKQSDGYRPMQLSDLAFAGFPEFARQWLLISRRSEFNPDTGLHQLYLNIGGSAGHHSLWALDIDEGHFPSRTWEVTLSKSSEARRLAAAQREEEKQAAAAERNRVAMEVFKKKAIIALGQVGPETAERIRDRAGIHKAKWPSVRAELYGDGAIIDVVIEKNGRQWDAIRLKPDQPETGIGASSVQSVPNQCIEPMADGQSIGSVHLAPLEGREPVPMIDPAQQCTRKKRMQKSRREPMAKKTKHKRRAKAPSTDT
jgi:hypothetical protein